MKILLCGACGRMGKTVTNLALERGETVVCGVDLAPKPAPYPVYSDFNGISEDAEVMIDFSSPLNLEERLRYAAEKGLPVVLGATGYTAQDEVLIAQYAKRIPLFKTGNLSIGINLLQLLAKKAAAVLGESFDVEIVERHHNRKKDAPSGTALMLAKSVEEVRQDITEEVNGRHGIFGERKQSEIGVHAVRGGTVVGEHEVGFYGEDEIITLSHSARSRSVFASGALKAAAWLLNQPAGLYNMDDLLKSML